MGRAGTRGIESGGYVDVERGGKCRGEKLQQLHQRGRKPEKAGEIYEETGKSERRKRTAEVRAIQKRIIDSNTKPHNGRHTR